MNSECDQLVGTQANELFSFHLPCEFQADVLHGHGVLPVFIYRETEGMYLAAVVGIGLEMKSAGSLSIVEITFALDFASVARDGEAHVLAARLRRVNAGERTGGPIGFVARNLAPGGVPVRETQPVPFSRPF